MIQIADLEVSIVKRRSLRRLQNMTQPQEVITNQLER